MFRWDRLINVETRVTAVNYRAYYLSIGISSFSVRSYCMWHSSVHCASLRQFAPRCSIAERNRANGRGERFFPSTDVPRTRNKPMELTRESMGGQSRDTDHPPFVAFNARINFPKFYILIHIRVLVLTNPLDSKKLEQLTPEFKTWQTTLVCLLDSVSESKILRSHPAQRKTHSVNDY